MDREKIKEEVIECINRIHNLEPHEDYTNTAIGIVLLGGDLEEILSSPTFELVDIYKEYRELRCSKIRSIVEYTMR